MALIRGKFQARDGEKKQAKIQLTQSMVQTRWQIAATPEIPAWLVDTVKTYPQVRDGRYLAQILWNRGINEPQQVNSFLDPQGYQPASPFEFGQEMKRASQRIERAWKNAEKVAIWGDFDADGVTSTSVLWEGLGQFFPQGERLVYYIPNRLRESHGLNRAGIDKLNREGVSLIVTCDTGSTNIEEINYANSLGIEIVITDHHTLPEERPQVTAILNPRYFAPSHPLYHLSGVGVAYKLMEALYQRFPDIPQQPLEELLDLVAIGLIADLVELKGDCRYLAQKGIEKLEHTKRHGLKKLLELCKRTGDRPADISFGIGPRINAVSRIQGDASFCVQLLTSKDPQLCDRLARETELANSHRKSLQKDILKQVRTQIEELDLSTTAVIVLENEGWHGGVLGLVASEIAQEYGRPAILLSAGQPQSRGEGSEPAAEAEIARGSARSVKEIDLYELVSSQRSLLHRFGGHPHAAGLSLPRENIPLFREGIDRQLRSKLEIDSLEPAIPVDLTVTAAELGQDLFRELKLLEPCGMGNPPPKLLLKNCWFTGVGNKNIRDSKNNAVQYIKTHFLICDRTLEAGFRGVWWGHYQDELIAGEKYDAVVELDFNTHEREYEVRIVALKLAREGWQGDSPLAGEEAIADGRRERLRLDAIATQPYLLEQCPQSWSELELEYKKALQRKQVLALVYPPPQKISPLETWQKLAGIAKYLLRTGKITTKASLSAQLAIGDRPLDLGLQVLNQLGIKSEDIAGQLQFTKTESTTNQQELEALLSNFLAALKENQFQQEYFYQAPLRAIQSKLEILSKIPQ